MKLYPDLYEQLVKVTVSRYPSANQESTESESLNKIMTLNVKVSVKQSTNIKKMCQCALQILS